MSQSPAKLVNIGVPEGSILGPLHFFLFVNDLPSQLIDATAILYADDTNLLISDRNESLLIKKVNAELCNLHRWCTTNAVTLNPTKTVFILFHSERRKILVHNDITYNNCFIQHADHTKFLGVVIDSHLKFHLHARNIAQKASYGLHVLCKCRHLFSREILFNLYYAFIHSHINYCIATWGCTYQCHLKSVQIIQKRALRIIMPNDTHIRGDDLFQNTDVLSVHNLVIYNIASIIYRIFHGNLTLLSVSLRLSPRVNECFSRYRLLLPKINTNYGRQTLEFRGSTIWNSLTTNLKTAPSLHSFLAQLKNSLHINS